MSNNHRFIYFHRNYSCSQLGKCYVCKHPNRGWKTINIIITMEVRDIRERR